MELFKSIVAVVGIIATIYFLIKKAETRTVLIGVGLIMSILTLNPMGALDAFAKSMTSGGLIMAICSSMGFAYVMKYTQCDTHLVHLLTKPLSGLKFFWLCSCGWCNINSCFKKCGCSTSYCWCSYFSRDFWINDEPGFFSLSND